MIVDVKIYERTAVAKFQKLDEQSWQAVRAKVIELTERLTDAVRAGAPHGKTGQLAGSIHSMIRESAHKIVGIVTSGKAYLPVIEFGLHKQLGVRSHTRAISTVFGNPVATVMADIGPYQRAASVEGAFFMQHALAGLDSTITAELQSVLDAIGEAVNASPD